MTKKKKLERLARQNELLKHFEGDHYQEKEVGDEWYVKMFNGGTKRWQVCIYSKEKFNKYKAFSLAKREIEEKDNFIKEIR